MVDPSQLQLFKSQSLFDNQNHLEFLFLVKEITSVASSYFTTFRLWGITGLFHVRGNIYTLRKKASRA